MRWLLVFALSGCSSILGIEDFKVGDAGGGDDAPEMGFCLGPVGWRICLPQQPTTAVTFSNAGGINTQANPQCLVMQPPSWKAAGQPDACIIVAGSITFDSADLQVTGDRPLVVFAADTITVTQRIDVASRGATIEGPANNAADCTAPTAATSSTSGGAGGGAGASLMGRGGKGGNASGGATGGAQAAVDAMPPQKLRGGCGGGTGGNSNNPGGRGGNGGGAIYLVAGSRIAINGFINASGAGGGGGGILAGGGGGGSGGMIVLHAPMIGGSGGVLIANGGGGGGGGGPQQSGSPGNDPVPANPTGQAGGGAGAGAGGAGFAGNAVATDGQAGSPVAANAGGGGGGAQGYIRANVAPTGLMASPAVMVGN